MRHAVASGLGANEPVFDKVIIVTDRVVLDRQLQSTVAGFDHTPGMIETIDKHKTSEDLRAALEGKKARIIVTTLQKFPVVAQAATALSGSRFAVIADEAHSSQTGEAVKDLKAVLSGKTGDDALQAAELADGESEAAGGDIEDALVASAQTRGKQSNLTFFAFTATPKSKTLEMFGELITDPAGDERYVAFHLYSMRQAIEEGFILDVLANYTTYKTYYRLANGLGGDDPVLPKGKAASALARYVSLHPTNLAQKAEIIVEHFRKHTAPKIGGRAKAMVVTRSRLHAVKYWQAITDYIKAKGYDTGTDPVRALVAFSGTVIDPDVPNVEYREALLNGFGEGELPKRFAADDYQVLVVAEKYQTGFDEPLLHTMYVDKRLDGIKAVQTLSRLNRTRPDKEDTFVLDFANDVETIQEAFRPYYTQSVASPTDSNILYTLQRRIDEPNILDPAEVERGVNAILTGGTKGSAELNAAIDPAVDRFEALDDEDEQEGFRTALRDFCRTYAFLAQIMPFTDSALERLYYYGKYLLTRLPTTDAGGAIHLDGSVILTHLRTELIAEQEDASLEEGSDEPLPGLGDGGGKQNTPVEEHLSELINAMNERFGLNLTDADRIWFEQQQQTLAEDHTVRAAAQGNDLKQFEVYILPRMDELIANRHNANDELFRAYFDKPEFKSLMAETMVKALYEKLRDKAS
ncbi:MAG: DEAD/DEAH box helicase family protein [Candidatus Nanopelagicales bacterium]